MLTLHTASEFYYIMKLAGLQLHLSFFCSSVLLQLLFVALLYHHEFKTDFRVRIAETKLIILLDSDA